MRFVPALRLSLALCLPTTAHPKGGCGEPDAGDLHVRFDERDVETGLWLFRGDLRRIE